MSSLRSKAVKTSLKPVHNDELQKYITGIVCGHAAPDQLRGLVILNVSTNISLLTELFPCSCSTENSEEPGEFVQQLAAKHVKHLSDAHDGLKAAGLSSQRGFPAQRPDNVNEDTK